MADETYPKVKKIIVEQLGVDDPQNGRRKQGNGRAPWWAPVQSWRRSDRCVQSRAYAFAPDRPRIESGREGEEEAQPRQRHNFGNPHSPVLTRARSAPNPAYRVFSRESPRAGMALSITDLRPVRQSVAGAGGIDRR